MEKIVLDQLYLEHNLNQDKNLNSDLVETLLNDEQYAIPQFGCAREFPTCDVDMNFSSDTSEDDECNEAGIVEVDCVNSFLKPCFSYNGLYVINMQTTLSHKNILQNIPRNDAIEFDISLQQDPKQFTHAFVFYTPDKTRIVNIPDNKCYINTLSKEELLSLPNCFVSYESLLWGFCVKGQLIKEGEKAKGRLIDQGLKYIRLGHHLYTTRDELSESLFPLSNMMKMEHLRRNNQHRTLIDIEIISSRIQRRPNNMFFSTANIDLITQVCIEKKLLDKLVEQRETTRARARKDLKNLFKETF